MGNIKDAFDTVYRDYQVDGVPASGGQNPLKSEIRAIGQAIDEHVEGLGTRVRLSRARISGSLSSLRWAATTPTVALSIGYLWAENNGGSPAATIAGTDPDTLNAGQGYIVNFASGPRNGSGHYIPQKIAIASLAATGWQSGDVFILAARDAQGNFFGEYRMPDAERYFGTYDGEVAFPQGTATPIPSWTPASRTLAWPAMTLLVKNAGMLNRINLAAGSVVFPAGGYLLASLDLAQVVNGGTPAAAVIVDTYTAGGWRGDETTRIPLFAVNGDNAYPIRFGPVRGSLIGPAPYDASEVVAIAQADRVHVYIKGSNPASNKYMLMNFRHNVNPASNCDVWRWERVVEVERTGDVTFTSVVAGQEIVTYGEQELAIRQVGKSDFMGGNAHGDEVLTSARFMVDGTEKALGTAGNYRGQRIEFFQVSDLFEADTVPAGSNRVAQVFKRWVFTGTGVDLFIRVEWEEAITLEAAKIGMLNLARTSGGTQISSTAYRAPYFAPEDISTAGFAEIATDAVDIKATGPSGYSAEVIPVKGFEREGAHILVTSNPAYNKIYPDVTGAGFATAPGDVFDCHIRYLINTVN